GLAPTLKGSIVPLAWNMIFFLVSSLLPYIVDREQGLKWGMFAVAGTMVTMVVTNLIALFLFGEITGQFVYPVITAARYIRFADFFENMEAIVMAIWISGSFIKLGVYHYV